MSKQMFVLEMRDDLSGEWMEIYRHESEHHLRALEREGKRDEPHAVTRIRRDNQE
jgi:hypothetical protein